MGVQSIVSNEREVTEMITIKDARKIVGKLSEVKDAVFINGVLITAYNPSGVHASFKVTYDETELTFWRGSLVIASISYEDVTSIETVSEVYNIKEGEWE